MFALPCTSRRDIYGPVLSLAGPDAAADTAVSPYHSCKGEHPIGFRMRPWDR